MSKDTAPSMNAELLSEIIFNALKIHGVLCTATQLNKHLTEELSDWAIEEAIKTQLFDEALKLPKEPRESPADLAEYMLARPSWVHLIEQIQLKDQRLKTDIHKPTFDESTRITRLPPIPPTGEFVVRTDTLSRITQVIQERPLVVLQGESGSGKTFLAREWAMRAFQANHYQHFIWIPCHKGLLNGIHESGLFERDGLDIAPTDRTLQSAIQKLATLEKCLIGLDNVDCASDEELLEIIQLPIHESRITLIATAETQLDDFPHISLPALTTQECQKLFYTTYSIELADDCLAVISEQVDHHTLTLKLISHIAQAQQLSLTQVLEYLQEQSFDTSDQTSKFIILLNFSQLSSAARRTLVQLAYLDHAVFEPNPIIKWLNLDSIDELDILVDHGWLTQTQHRQHSWYKVHPLLSRVIKAYNQIEQDDENGIRIPNHQHILKSMAASLCNKTFNNQHPGDYHLLPHIETFLTFFAHEQTQTIGMLYSWLGFLHHHQGYYTQAELYYKKSLENHKQVWGPTHAKTASSYENLAGLYVRQRDFEKAAPLLEAAVKLKQNKHHDSESESADCLDSLGSLYLQQGLFEKAFPLFEDAMKIRENTLGTDHLETANSYNHLGSLYAKQRQYKQAEPLLLKGLAIKTSLRGETHLDIAHCYNNLGSLYRNMGIFEKALHHYQKSLQIREIQLGSNHPDTIHSFNNIADLYLQHGDFNDAEVYFTKALTSREATLGSEHPDTAHSISHLAGLYLQEGLYEKAHSLYDKVIQIDENALGKEHPGTATAINNLAGLYMKQGIFKKAESLYKKATSIRENIVGQEHPDLANSLNNLASLYIREGHYDKAEPLLQKSLKIQKIYYGPHHPEIAHSLNNLADLYLIKGLYDSAEPLFIEALDIREKKLGNDNPNTAISLNNLACLYLKKGDYNRAEPYFVRAKRIREKIFPGDHPDIADSLNNLAGVYSRQGHLDKAETFFNKALAIRTAKLGEEHPDTADSLNNVAHLYLQQNQYDKAAHLFLKALKIYESSYGIEHMNTATNLNNLAGVYLRQGLTDKAERLYQKALAICSSLLGPEHPRTRIIRDNLSEMNKN